MGILSCFLGSVELDAAYISEVDLLFDSGWLPAFNHIAPFFLFNQCFTGWAFANAFVFDQHLAIFVCAELPTCLKSTVRCFSTRSELQFTVRAFYNFLRFGSVESHTSAVIYADDALGISGSDISNLAKNSHKRKIFVF
jgi:hypothetical protein